MSAWDHNSRVDLNRGDRASDCCNGSERSSRGDDGWVLRHVLYANALEV